MDSQLQEALANLLIGLADDELILAHRNSEWTGHGPILEEDIAFSNIAQDEMGHATLWYQIACDLTGDEPDRLVFFRDAADFRNVQMVELPNGDWAFSMLRQYLFDAAELVRLGHLVDSSYQPIADAAAKIRREEIYHLRHTSSWVKRLGLGTEESHGRTQAALDQLWAYAQQLFSQDVGEGQLILEGFAPDSAALRDEWLKVVKTQLADSGLAIPEMTETSAAGRTEHTRHLRPLLAEMQQVARLDAQAEW